LPIEIKELRIRVSVSSPETGKPAGVPGPPLGTAGESREAMVAQCVEQVMQILRDHRER